MKLLAAFTTVLYVAAAVPFNAPTIANINDISLEVRGQGDNLPAGNWNAGWLADLLTKIKDTVQKNKNKGSIPKASQFTSWKTFKGNGVNLGGWLAIEKGIDPKFFNDNGASAAVDEDSFCAVLGKIKCALLLEYRYATFFKTSDIDLYASYGVNVLRIPVSYWAFMPAVNGDHYHTGSQLFHMARIANYAISKGMHIIVDLHGLPGGQNGLDNQGKTGDLNWWNNQTNFDYSMKTVDLATTWILKQPRPEQFTLGLINEPLKQGFYFFGQTLDSVDYLNKYYTAAVSQIRKRTAKVPIMLSDGFAGPQIWEPVWANSNQNIVIDTHIYFFSQGTYAYDAPYDACYLAKSYQVSTNPVFIGEWSIQASKFNSGDVPTRSLFYNSQLAAYLKFLAGGSFWNAKHFGDVIVGTDGTDQSNFWSWEKLAQQGVVVKAGVPVDTATC
ncbi:hypothetical protein VTL71DRAFT_3581 [Oculimacula yallundae]|uniref:glucan 1,3-beta-glucosidase n=1 Tax=Oculimacula yallundae TaxID=86028 RepID=A0ABR4C9G2_9HELO